MSSVIHFFVYRLHPISIGRSSVEHISFGRRFLELSPSIHKQLVGPAVQYKGQDSTTEVLSAPSDKFRDPGGFVKKAGQYMRWAVLDPFMEQELK